MAKNKKNLIEEVDVWTKRTQKFDHELIDKKIKEGKRMIAMFPIGDRPGRLSYRIVAFFEPDPTHKMLEKIEKIEKMIKKLKAPSKLGKKSKDGKAPNVADDNSKPE